MALVKHDSMSTNPALLCYLTIPVYSITRPVFMLNLILAAAIYIVLSVYNYWSEHNSHLHFYKKKIFPFKY